MRFQAGYATIQTVVKAADTAYAIAYVQSALFGSISWSPRLATYLIALDADIKPSDS
jgi:hypothetical protein